MFDCGSAKEKDRFGYRAGAIIIEDGCVLLAGNKCDNYLYSVGGGVRLGEKAEDAVVREVFEETGVRCEIDRPAVIHENFFDESGGVLQCLNCREISFYFIMKPRGSRELHSNSYTHGAKEEMHRIPISELYKYKAFPSFLIGYLSREHDCHDCIEHIITDERTHSKGSAPLS